MTSIGRKIVSGTFWAALDTWGRQVTVFAVFVLLARLLGPEDFGLAALAMVVSVILVAPVTRGIPDALVQRQTIEEIHLSSAFWLLAGCGAAMAALIFLCAGAIAYLFGAPSLEGLVRATSVVVFVQSLGGVPAAILKRDLNFQSFAVRTFVATCTGGVVGICMALAGFGPWSLVGMQIARTVVETLILFIATRWRPRLRYSHEKCRELFGFAGPLVGQALWNFLNEELPKVILGSFIGPYAVGIYALARKPLDLLTEAFLAPIIAVSMPAVSRLQGDISRIDRYFDTTVRLAGLIGFPVFMGFATIAPLAVPFVFGDQWIGSILATQILMFLGLQRTIDSICAYTMIALGHSALILKLCMSYTVLALILLPGAAWIGLEATMVVLVLCNFLLLPVFLYLAGKLAHVDVARPLVVFPRVIVATLLMVGAVATWMAAAPPQTPPGIVIALGVLLGATAYGLAAVGLLRPDLINARETILRLRS